MDKAILQYIKDRAAVAQTLHPVAACVMDLCLYIMDLEKTLEKLEDVIRLGPPRADEKEK